ncbi:MAG: NTP transferase domain-containing protein, partial [Cyanobium sp.]
ALPDPAAPPGSSWLERTLQLLLQLEMPVTLLSRHAAHLQLARGLSRDQAARAAASDSPGPSLTALAEPPPWEGPLLALHRLMQRHPGERLLLCPVDMPKLNKGALQALLAAAAEQPQWIHLAHDGERCQPLLGVYPRQATLRADLSAAVARGERRLQSWLAEQACREVRLDPGALRNINRPEDLASAMGTRMS